MIFHLGLPPANPSVEYSCWVQLKFSPEAPSGDSFCRFLQIHSRITPQNFSQKMDNLTCQFWDFSKNPSSDKLFLRICSGTLRIFPKGITRGLKEETTSSFPLLIDSRKELQKEFLEDSQKKTDSEEFQQETLGEFSEGDSGGFPEKRER